MSTDERRDLFLPLAPHRTGALKVSDLHTLYFEESGAPDGLPVVMLHGGPGGAINPVMRRTHDPAVWRVIDFDQRGCGRSTPNAELRENTTWDLVADMERLREHLGVERWQVCGGSWGSALALAYAQTHPERVSSLILRGIFTLRERELAWFYQSGADAIFPDAWEAFVAPIPPEERGDLIGAYHRRLTGEDEPIKLACAQAWSVWEGTTLSLLPFPARAAFFALPAFAVAFARIENHYFVNGGFFEPRDQLIRNSGRLRGVPGVIVQGRYDVVTPMFTAWELAKAWPDAELVIVPDAGHAPTEPGAVDAVVRAAERLALQP
jgi:proline iminopeptidase